MCVGGGGVVIDCSQTSWFGEPFNLITLKSYLIGSDTLFKKKKKQPKTAFLAIQFICDRRIQCGTKHVGNSVFYMCKQHCRDSLHIRRWE